ncbi:MAG: TRAP transporter small permease [Reyranellaceae bacterium]
MSELPNDLEAEQRAGMTGWERAIARFFLVSAGVALVLMSLLTVADVIGRSFNSPLPAATELTEFLMVIVIFCALPVVTRRGDHIVIDILDFIVPPSVRRFEDVVINLLGAMALAAAAWRVWTLALRAASGGDFTPYLQIPMAPIIHFVSILCVFVAVAFLINSVRAILGRKTST